MDITYSNNDIYVDWVRLELRVCFFGETEISWIVSGFDPRIGQHKIYGQEDYLDRAIELAKEALK